MKGWGCGWETRSLPTPEGRLMWKTLLQHCQQISADFLTFIMSWRSPVMNSVVWVWLLVEDCSRDWQRRCLHFLFHGWNVATLPAQLEQLNDVTQELLCGGFYRQGWWVIGKVRRGLIELSLEEQMWGHGLLGEMTSRGRCKHRC